MITKEKAVTVLKTCKDPELDLDVYTLGLIYNVEIAKDVVDIKMTFTSPMCPYGPMLLEQIKGALMRAGAKTVNIDVVFDPPWKPSEEVKEMLGMAD